MLTRKVSYPFCNRAHLCGMFDRNVIPSRHSLEVNVAIKSNVRTEHLAEFPAEELWLKTFLSVFDITWARRRQACNTELSVYFLKPHLHTQEAFGFEHELMLVYSPFETLEARSIQAAEQILHEAPARGRVERLTYLVVSEMPSAVRWIEDYVSGNQEARLIAGFYAQDLRSRSGDSWFVRNELGKQFYGRDLFDFRLPLEHDTYFFGREADILAYRSAILSGENRGLFGLRKTGKTSFLFKIQRMARKEGVASIHYVDCQDPGIRTMRWHQLLRELTGRIDPSMHVGEGIPDIVKAFDNAIRNTTNGQRQVLLFDEIEYISPRAKLDPHWKDDFISFWQTIRSCQVRHRKFSFILAGVNPGVTEISEYEGIPNPLFGIVSPQYLCGLPLDDLKRMVKTLGKRIGLTFSPDAIDYLHSRYGGHPLLTRIACSLVHASESRASTRRPIALDRSYLTNGQTSRDTELSFYCEHVVSELRHFYEDEYAMLEMLARKQVAEFMQLASDGMVVTHLREYGLLAEASGLPQVAIPVIEAYVAARGGGTYLVPAPERAKWIAQRTSGLIRDLRSLERRIHAGGRPPLFGPNSFPEADRLVAIIAVDTRDGFGAFINTLNRCLVESIEKFGQSIGSAQYFWSLKSHYPTLHSALERIKVYRHNLMHILLKPAVEAKLCEYLQEDLGGRQPQDVDDLWFSLQQRVLDALFLAVQVETATLP